MQLYSEEVAACIGEWYVAACSYTVKILRRLDEWYIDPSSRVEYIYNNINIINNIYFTVKMFRRALQW